MPRCEFRGVQGRHECGRHHRLRGPRARPARGLDPVAEPGAVRRLVDEVISDYDERSLSATLPPLGDPREAAREVFDAVAGFGPLQKYLDDPTVEEIWINEPTKVFIARRGVHELTTTILTADEVRDLVERMLKSSGRRVDLSTPFVDAMLPDGSRLHVVDPRHHPQHWAVNIRKFVVRATHLDDLVAARHAHARRPPASSRRPSSPGSTSWSPAAPRPARPRCSTASRPRSRRGERVDHLRGGLRAEDPAARLGVDAVPAAQPRGHRRDPAARAGQGGAADAAVAGSSSARSGPGGEPRPAHRPELRAARACAPSTPTPPARRSPRCARCRCWRARTSATRSSCRPSRRASTWSCTSQLERDGRRRVREICAVPGPGRGRRRRDRRLFVARGDRLVRADGWPPHPSASSGGLRPRPAARSPTARGVSLMGALVGLLLGLGPVPDLAVVHAARADAATRSGPTRRDRTCADLLAQAGIEAVTPGAAARRLRRRRRRRASSLMFVVSRSPADRPGVRRDRGVRAARAGAAAAPGSAGPSCASCGRRSSTTSRPACAPGCRCPRR